MLCVCFCVVLHMSDTSPVSYTTKRMENGGWMLERAEHFDTNTFCTVHYVLASLNFYAFNLYFVSQVK